MREVTTQAMPGRFVEEKRQSRRGHFATTRRAEGGAGDLCIARYIQKFYDEFAAHITEQRCIVA